MADFTHVHRHVKIPDHLRPGEPFQFVLLEVCTRADVDKIELIAGPEERYVVTVKIENDRLVPFSDTDKKLIDDWKARNKDEPDWNF